MNYMIMPGIKDCRTFNLSPKTIMDVILEHFEIPMDILMKHSRKREIVLVRQVAFYFLRNHAHLTLKAIGRIFGGRDHTTIIHGLETIEDLRPQNEKLQNDINLINKKLYL